VIEGYIGSNGMITIGSSTFTNCKVDTDSGLGGAIYLQITSGYESNFLFVGISYSGCEAKYGKSLFINALGDL
jgi:hypothetical protein